MLPKACIKPHAAFLHLSRTNIWTDVRKKGWIILTFFTPTVLMGALELGLIYALLALGIFISFRILNIPDLSVDGTFTLGVSVSAIFAYYGHPVWGIVFAVLAGALAGSVTGLLQTKLRVQPILAGILTMTALYSINLHVLQRKPNISLYQKPTIFNQLPIPSAVRNIVLIAAITIAVAAVLYFFLKTQLGMSLRATGDNEFMVRASSIDSDAMKILGFALANGLVSLSGGVIAQYQNYADANGGIGMLVVGLASIIVGEAVFGRKSILLNMLAAIFGAVLYRYILTIALQIGMDAIDLKLFSAIIVGIAISLPLLKKLIGKRKADRHVKG